MNTYIRWDDDLEKNVSKCKGNLYGYDFNCDIINMNKRGQSSTYIPMNIFTNFSTIILKMFMKNRTSNKVYLWINTDDNLDNQKCYCITREENTLLRRFIR